MIKTYRDSITAEIADGVASNSARRRIPEKLWGLVIDRMAQLHTAKTIYDFWKFPSLKFERLKDDRKDQCSIRINGKYRICFRWEEPDAYDVEIVDYH